MDRMLVVVFDNESQAYEGKKALLQLDGEGSMSVYGYAVLAKNADGTASVKQGDDVGPIGSLVGTSLGSLIGMLAGPVGLAVGASAGLLAGGTADINNAGIGYDFIDDVSKVLLPNRVGVIAEIDEEWTTPVDTRMEAIGGTDSRRECRRDEGRPHPTKGRTRQGPCRPESETPGEDQPARLQDTVSTTERKRQTRCIATEGTGQS